MWAALRTLLMFVGTAISCSYAIAQSTASGSYRTVASILALSSEEAARGNTAQLRGVVTKPTDLGLFMQDRTAGIYINWDRPASLAAGDEVEVSGVVSAGLFSPVVKALSVRKVGTDLLPRPTPVTFKQLATGKWDSQYVTVTGIVRSAGLRPRVLDSEKLWLKIATPDGVIYAAFPSRYLTEANGLIDATVRIDAVATATKNLKRQITAAVLSVAGIRNLTVLKRGPTDLFAGLFTPIDKLMQYRAGTDYDHRVRVSGIVTYSKSGDRLILEDQGNALLVMTTQTSNIKPGDRVEAVGFPTPQSPGPILQDAVLRFTAPGLPARPRPAGIDEILSGSLNNNLVSIEGHLVRRLLEPSREVLLLQIGSNLLEAELRDSKDPNALKYLQDGSTIRVSGVTIVEVEGSWHVGGPEAGTVNSIILLRSAADVQVIRPPSWWTTLHVIYIAVALGILLLAFLALIVYNHMERWRLRAVFDERERLANEMHDTLAQSFAGIGFQLQAIRKAISSETPLLRQQVDLARSLVRHSHKEARRSIEPLDPGSIILDDLMGSLAATASKMVEGCSVEIATLTTGTEVQLPATISVALLRIGQEAIANAIRHADPSRLEIAIAYERDAVRLSVTDNGSGFVKSGDLLGFGLRGMRKRSAAISAKLEISSLPGEGTRVEVVAPLPPNLTPAIIFKRVWKHLSESRPNADAKNT